MRVRRSGKEHEMTNKELEDYLRTTCPGRKNSRRSAELEAELNISGNELRRRINRLRRDAVPIGSSRDGYFYAVTAGEVYATIGQLTDIALGLQAAINGLESALDRFGEKGAISSD